MIAIGIALASALLLSLFFTPVFIKILTKRNYGQFIRQDGPEGHFVKRGTPTMGGVVIIGATVVAWILAHIVSGHLPSWSAILLIFLFVGTGVIGFIDDFIKISKQRSLGLHPSVKIAGQLTVGTLFAIGAVFFPDKTGYTPASYAISVVRDTPINLAHWGVGIGIVLLILWVNFLIASWSNGVNLTDGLDGLATGASLFAFGSYCLVSVWQWYQKCPGRDEAIAQACYAVRDPGDLAIISAAIVGACFGFLWWNTSPAQIFMGDTGSLALGGAFAGLSILTRTEFLAIIIGGLFLLIVLSDVIQISVFKLTKKRVFRMAPLHHHFELKGWPEVTIVVRFWIIAGVFAVTGIALFYAEWVVAAL